MISMRLPKLINNIKDVKCTLFTKLDTFLLDLNVDATAIVRFLLRSADEEQSKHKYNYEDIICFLQVIIMKAYK